MFRRLVAKCIAVAAVVSSAGAIAYSHSSITVGDPTSPNTLAQRVIDAYASGARRIVGEFPWPNGVSQPDLFTISNAKDVTIIDNKLINPSAYNPVTVKVGDNVTDVTNNDGITTAK